ncbi:MAG: anthranilate synthase component I [Candidatus Gygaella obscura]|nr:anthranilate synthase component I [Candidatus Gygaella obscura]
MIYPSEKEFLRYSKKGNLIPVYEEIIADMETPVSSYIKISNCKYSYLLESVEGKEKIARFSFLGANPSVVISSKGKVISFIEYGKRRKIITKTNPIDEIKRFIEKFKFVHIKGLPRFCGGLVGFMSYDMVRFIEDIPDKNIDDLNIPDSVFMFTDTILLFDHTRHKIKIVSNVHLKNSRLTVAAKKRLYKQALKKIQQIKQSLDKSVKINRDHVKNRLPRVTSNLSRQKFIQMVKKAKTYIQMGDIIQVVLSQRFKTKIKRPVFDIYRRLRSINPSPYMFFLKLDKIDLIGSSPELLVRCEDSVVQTRPIAGTRPRGINENEDKNLEKSLLEDEKERAEHVMLVDLGRNDLGRVCKKGSVKLKEFMAIERYSHVMHIVSDVTGILHKKKSVFDCLTSCFPAGTVTGAPKVRAMEIIDELETVKRSIYAGCVGYFSFSGNLDTCITIRSILIKDGFAYIQAGAGIVADSVAEKEFNETLNKAKAQLSAL